MKERKIYVIGGSNGYANWMNGSITRNMEEANLVVLTGGADINPSLYGEKVGQYTHFYDHRDELEIREYHQAKMLKKKIIGICRGAQLMTVMNGGKLIQHMSHRGNHGMTTFDGETVIINSLHHQMCYPFDIPGAKVLGWCSETQKSPVHLNGDNQEVELPDDFVEPEIIYFNENELGIQYHPEMMSDSMSGMQKTIQIFETWMQNGFNFEQKKENTEIEYV